MTFDPSGLGTLGLALGIANGNHNCEVCGASPQAYHLWKFCTKCLCTLCDQCIEELGCDHELVEREVSANLSDLTEENEHE